MWDAIVGECSRYIQNTEEPLRWLPIAALVWLLFDGRSLQWFWTTKERQRFLQEPLESVQRKWFSEHRRRKLLWCVTVVVSSVCACMFAVCERRPSFCPNVGGVTGRRQKRPAIPLDQTAAPVHALVIRFFGEW